jgi:hypothetical protein
LVRILSKKIEIPTQLNNTETRSSFEYILVPAEERGETWKFPSSEP